MRALRIYALIAADAVGVHRHHSSNDLGLSTAAMISLMLSIAASVSGHKFRKPHGITRIEYGFSDGSPAVHFFAFSAYPPKIMRNGNIIESAKPRRERAAPCTRNAERSNGRSPHAAAATPHSMVESGGTRTHKTGSRRILSPLRMPIPPRFPLPRTSINPKRARLFSTRYMVAKF